jgi:hypothetical protein
MRRLLAPGLLLVACAGCSRTGVTHLYIENPQGYWLVACPIEVDPNVRVVTQEITTSDDGFVLRQRLVISGPIKIVPSDTATWARLAGPSTQPAASGGP